MTRSLQDASAWVVGGPGKIEALLWFLWWTALSVAVIAGINQRMQVEHLPIARALLPEPTVPDRQVSLRFPGYGICAEATSYGDEIFAYLMFDYLRHPFHSRSLQLLLTFDPEAESERYRLTACGQRDALAAIASLAGANVAGLVNAGEWRVVPERQLAGMKRETDIFTAAYNMPVRWKLEQLPRDTISRYVERFIRFKSTTDPRIRRRLEPVPTALSPEEAQSLASDIITVARFYELPLDMFLGVGAMENNYMNVRGDLKHTIWKRRPAPDDIVVERRRGRVRVLNDSAGVWQITRETLRYAHRLYLKDKRDYSVLPERLRPDKTLSVGEVSPVALTTYAGLLLRDLLDRFDGDLTLAVSAYNGGPGRPNLTYGKGVHSAAVHARRALEQAAVLNGESVLKRQWLR